jgi:hypothetical protein
MDAFDAILNILDKKGAEQDALPFASLHQAGVQPFPTANIATDLEPIVKVHSGSKAFIVGYDGANLSAPDYPWVRILKEWLDAGCDVTYLLLNPSPKSLEALAPLSITKTSGRLCVYGIDKSKAGSPRTLEMINQWRAFHFAIFEDPRQLWVECDHQPGDTKARDCYFFPEDVAKKPGLPDILKSKFEYVVRTCGMNLITQN